MQDALVHAPLDIRERCGMAKEKSCIIGRSEVSGAYTLPAVKRQDATSGARQVWLRLTAAEHVERRANHGRFSDGSRRTKPPNPNDAKRECAPSPAKLCVRGEGCKTQWRRAVVTRRASLPTRGQRLLPVGTLVAVRGNAGMLWT
jgi:hypothetical protein